MAVDLGQAGLGGGFIRRFGPAFRPHAVRPTAAPGPGDGFAFEATIGSAEFLGEFVRYELAISAHRALADLPHARFAETLAPGARASFAVPADEILILAE